MKIIISEVLAFDYLLGFVYLIFIYIGFFIYKNNKIEKDTDYQYFIYALHGKMFGVIGFVFLTLFYWKGGDTLVYYEAANRFTGFVFENPIEGFKILFGSATDIHWYRYEFANGYHKFLGATDTFTAVKLTAILNVIGFRSYVTTSLLFAAFSFIGVWNMYLVFCKVYPHLKKQLLISFFFIPSVILWGSGILKDTITLASVGLLLYSFINLIILRRKRTLSLILIITATFFIALLKPYILYVLYPALFIWVQSNLKSIIPSQLFRNLLAPFVALSLVFSASYLTQELSQNAGKYDVNKLGKTLEGFQSWHTTVSETHDDSGYTLGEMEFTPIGVVKKIPAAIGVTFFRPYLWEVKNASSLLGAIEGIVLLIMSLRLLLKLRFKLFRIIYKNKDILFLVIFSLVFGVMVGISSYNFGALSRYKMPAQMFFVLALVLINDKTKSKNYR